MRKFRAKTLLYFACILTFSAYFLSSCSPLSGEDEGDDRDIRRRSRTEREGRGGRENGPSERGEREDFSFDEGETDEENTDFRSITVQGEAEGAEGGMELVEPLSQDSISKKIDFLFVIDASPNNRKNIEFSNLEEKMGSFLHQLNRINIDWRIYAINADSGENKRSAKHRNGLLNNFENAGSEVLTQYLDKNVLEPYGSSVDLTSVFLHSISHDSKQNCELPPYCHKTKDHRPLKATAQFLSLYSHVLRDGADLIAVIISSQDEQPAPKKPKVPYDAKSLVEVFQNSFSGEHKNFHAISIVIPSGESYCPGKSRSEKPASHIPQLSIITRGLVIPICLSQQGIYSSSIIKFIQDNS